MTKSDVATNAGPRAGTLSGRTGICHLTADRLNLADHLQLISAFRRGPAGATPPAIPGDFGMSARELGADIETDFETD